ncbi:SRPBCC family protein [Methanobacterium sp. BAmetb5]|uniref:SRPBCC family protein n=1 Tax=Methanobacterium sp. BAmetb5 TaxID=2025351 RepID=UPI000E9F950B|nr:SRPBCC family protein [Methanobacterium sp. BAmetb5]AXV39856.1 MAG: polyketide cyclase [Methanobacterium sp. BAmetb5]
MVSVNEKAPVLAKVEIEIDADPHTVWDILTDIEAWPRWNPDVKEVILHGKLEPGTHFQWKAGPGKISSVLQNIEPPHRIAWTGKTMGINAIDVFKIEGVEGKTRVVEEESWEGLLSRAMHGQFQKMLEESLNSGLEHLKIEAERVHNQE